MTLTWSVFIIEVDEWHG